MRSFKFLVSVSLVLLVGCGVNVAPMDGDHASSNDLSTAISEVEDFDANGVLDLEQSFVIGGTEKYGAVFFVKPGPKLPDGSSANQALGLRGYGSGQYSSETDGWESNFMSMVPVYSNDTGELVWYGVAGLRPGVYEISCATDDADLGSLDGWCLLGEAMAPGDEREELITVTDGDATCPRESVHAAFQVWSDYIVTPFFDRISATDPTCY